MATDKVPMVPLRGEETLVVHLGKQLKADSERIFSNSGLTLEDAVRALLNRSVEEGGFPFEIWFHDDPILSKIYDEILANIYHDGMASGKDEGWVSSEEAIEILGE